jgi:hypothetical protein
MRGETSARVSGFGGSAKDEEEALPSCIFCAPSVGFGSELSFDYVAIGILVYGTLEWVSLLILWERLLIDRVSGTRTPEVHKAFSTGNFSTYTF